MEMTRTNVFSSVSVGGSEQSRLFSVLALKRVGFSLADVQSDVLLPSCLHVTAFSIDQLLLSMTFCDMLAHVLQVVGHSS